MTTAVLTNGLQYAIPNYDTDFFTKLANKMGWRLVQKSQEVEQKPVSWTDGFVGRWQDTRTTEQMLQEIHDARTANETMTV